MGAPASRPAPAPCSRWQALQAARTACHRSSRDVGYQRIEEGDRVSAAGFLKNAFFDELELHATSIVTLDRDATKTTGDTG